MGWDGRVTRGREEKGYGVGNGSIVLAEDGASVWGRKGRDGQEKGMGWNG